MRRRELLQSSLATALSAACVEAAAGKQPRTRLRSTWQVVNIGDIAHTPGELALVEKHLPATRVGTIAG